MSIISISIELTRLAYPGAFGASISSRFNDDCCKMWGGLRGWVEGPEGRRTRSGSDDGDVARTRIRRKVSPFNNKRLRDEKRE